MAGLRPVFHHPTLAGSSGIGLTIVRTLVAERMGGCIALESRPAVIPRGSNPSDFAGAQKRIREERFWSATPHESKALEPSDDPRGSENGLLTGDYHHA